MPGQASDDNFEIRGPITPHKHVTVRFYETMLGHRAADFLLIGGLRHPLDRMLSLYYYPGNWIKDRIIGGKRLSARGLHRLDPLLIRRETPYWDESRFLRMVAEKPTMSDFYRRADGSVRLPDVRLTASTMTTATRTIAQHLGIDDLRIPHINRSLRPGEVARLSKSRELAELVATAHAEDYNLFDYSLLPGN
ncbi:hypothetical protein [Microbacterium schleiferi]|uniref:hypothetical protein n=1 Tax=Microbacterium schleiferi TaxID=69362 RepID=UPI0035AB9DA0